MTHEEIIDVLTTCLEPTGPHGFEGLIARLLEQLTNQKFFLALSGSQGGKDLASGLRIGNMLAVECKRYRDDTKLSVDSLIAKLHQASMAAIPPDVWILVTTKRLGLQHHEQITMFGRDAGIDCILLDSEDGAESDLIALLALSPDMVADFLQEFGRDVPLGCAKSVKEWLQTRSESGDCKSTHQRLRKEMLEGCLGLEHWRHISREQLQGVLHDSTLCRARLDQDLAVLGEQAKLVERKELHAGLTAWYANWITVRRPCVVLGEEGEGKSWALTHWLAESMIRADSPCLIFLSANNVRSAEPQDLVTSEIARTFRSDQFFAEKRLRRWLGQPASEAPLLVLVLDGLNEYPRGPWGALLSRLQTEPWVSHIAVLMTCRTLYWQEHLASRFPEISTLEIAPFDDQELEQALTLRDVTRQEIDDTLLPLIRIPRYLDLMVRLRTEILESGEVTKERLIYEDQFDRWRRRTSTSPHQLNRNEFQEFLHRLAERLLSVDEVPRSEIVTELNAFGTGLDLLEELATGRILERKGSRGWTVNRRYLVLAFGLLLAESAYRAGADGDESIDEAVRDFLEPQSDMDIKAEICGFALLHALERADAGFSLPVRLALFRAWIQGRNIQEHNWARLPAYLPKSPETYLAMAEWLWSRERNQSQAQDALMAGFLRHARNPRIQQSLVVAFERWFGFVHPDGHLARYWVDDPQRLEEGRASVRAAFGNTLPESGIELDGFRLVINQDQGLLRLSRVALAVISHLDRQPFLRAIVIGMLANTVMGQPDSPELYYWTVRTAPDPIEPHLLGLAAYLIARGSVSGQKTADFLLGALATKRAATLRQTIAADNRYSNHFRELWLRDPCRLNVLFDKETAPRCLTRADVDLGAKLRLSKQIALDPTTIFPNAFIELAARVEFGFDLDQIASNINGVTSEDHDLDEIEAAMCAAAPLHWTEFLRCLIRELANREGDGLWLLADRVFEWLPILTDTEREVIEQRWKHLLEQDSSSDHGRFAEDVLFQCVLWARSASEQLSAYRLRAGRSTWVLGREAPSAPIPEDVACDINALLKASQDDAVISNLLAFLASSLECMTNDLRETLLDLCGKRKTEFGSWCREIFLKHGDLPGITSIIEGDTKFTGDDAILNEPAASLLICEYGSQLGFDEVMRRVAPHYLGLAVERRGRLPDEVNRYAEIIDHLLDISGIGSEALLEKDRSVVLPVDFHDLDDFLPQWKIDDRGDGKIVFLSAGHGWGGNPRRDNDPDWAGSNVSSAEITQRHNTQVRYFRELLDLARTSGNPILARRFREEALDAVVSAHFERATSWVQKVMADTPEARNLLVNCRGFYEALCQALLDSAPEEGAALYRRLTEIPHCRLVDRATGIDNSTLTLFRASISEPVNRLRVQMLEQCSCDLDLFELALAAQFSGSITWFSAQVDRWMTSMHPFDQARGIYLLGMLDDPTAETRLTEISVEYGDCWLGSRAQRALRIHQHNQWAKIWFTRFLEVGDNIRSWAAFRLFLRCVDRRFWLWGSGLLENSQIAAAIRCHYLANRLAIAKAAKANERGALSLHDHLVGDKVLNEQAWPWMSRFSR